MRYILEYCSIVFTSSNEAIQNVGMMKSASEMENSVFQKVRSQDEYQNMVTKLLMHMQSEYTTNPSRLPFISHKVE